VFPRGCNLPGTECLLLLDGVAAVSGGGSPTASRCSRCPAAPSLTMTTSQQWPLRPPLRFGGSRRPRPISLPPLGPPGGAAHAHCGRAREWPWMMDPLLSPASSQYHRYGSLDRNWTWTWVMKGKSRYALTEEVTESESQSCHNSVN